jgi:hypothetical protein
MLLLVGLAILLVYLLQLLQQQLKAESKDESGRTTVSVKSGMSALPAVIVSLINFGLVFSSKKLSEREYHPTKTHEAASTALKMTTALVTNTSLVLFLLNLKSTNWYTSGGLVVDLYWMLLVNTLSPPLFQALDLSTKMRRFMRCFMKYPEKITRLPRSKGDKLLKFWEPSEFNSTRRYANALQTFICCAIYQPLMPHALIAAFVGICLQYVIDKYMLLRIHKRPSIPEGPGLAHVMLQTCRFFICLGLPVSTTIFLWPSFDRGSGFWTSIILGGWAIGFISYILPDAVQRSLLCTCICLRRAKFKVSDDAAEIDYYSAQYVWPADMKYHKAHDLYKMLPERLNPENFEPGTGVLSQDDMRGNYTNATESLADQTLQDNQYTRIGAPMLRNHAKHKPTTTPGFTAVQTVPVTAPVHAVQPVNQQIRQDLSFNSAPLSNYAGNHTMPGLKNHAVQDTSTTAVPGAAGTLPGYVAAGPTWEWELGSGAWNKYEDCNDFVEQRYQEYVSKRGGPRRKITTCGREVTINFEDMTQTVEGSHNKRAIRRVA